MSSTSWKQHKFMEAVKHSPEFARKAGVPQSVGRDFSNADDSAGITKSHSKYVLGGPVSKSRRNYAKGGIVDDDADDYGNNIENMSGGDSDDEDYS